jgi:D-amino-acid dehydrogenase
MNVLVLGSGVIGVTSAYYLNQSGHEVTVLDRQPEPAMETSFANAGQVSWSYANPWAAPGIPLKALNWMFRKRAPLVLKPKMDPAMWSWIVRMIANCRRLRYEANKDRMMRLARYSHGCLKLLREKTGIHYDERSRGVLQLLRDEPGLNAARADIPILERLDIPYTLLDRAGCLAAEPGLERARVPIAGGLHFPGDESGDCHQFTLRLARLASESGVRFRPSTTIRRIAASANCVDRVVTDRGEFKADAYIVAAGSYSPLLLRPLKIRLPVYPVKGYSVTVPIRDETAAPVSTLTDETYKVAVTRLGDRIRVAGTAELSGYDVSVSPRQCDTIVHVLSELFPDCADMTKARYWAGLRPMTPDNVPVIGRTPLRNLFVNTGHGTLGWTMSCGSARVLSDLISGRTPDVNLEGMTLARYG